MTSFAVVDSSALIAAADARDPRRMACIDVLMRPDLRRVIPAMCVAECSYMLGRAAGPLVEAQFLEGLAQMDVRAPEAGDWRRIGELVRQYADFPLGGTDASVVTLAERLRTDIVITLDRRHFGAIKPAHCESLRILPE